MFLTNLYWRTLKKQHFSKNIYWALNNWFERCISPDVTGYKQRKVSTLYGLLSLHWQRQFCVAWTLWACSRQIVEHFAIPQEEPCEVHHDFVVAWLCSESSVPRCPKGVQWDSKQVIWTLCSCMGERCHAWKSREDFLRSMERHVE